MLVAMHWKLGHPGHGNLSHPSTQCDVHATQHHAAFVPPPPSPKHLYITCTDRVYNGVYTPKMILEPEPVDIYTANPTIHSKHTNTVTKLLRLWLVPHITAVCVQQGTPGICLLLFVLEWPSCWSFNCTPPPHFLSLYTLPNTAK